MGPETINPKPRATFLPWFALHSCSFAKAPRFMLSGCSVASLQGLGFRRNGSGFRGVAFSFSYLAATNSVNPAEDSSPQVSLLQRLQNVCNTRA